MAILAKLELKVADEVWIITALLHRENPSSLDFSIDQIMDRARTETVAGKLRPGFYVHVIQHCVANRAPNPGRYRILFETARDRRRLFRKGDTYHHDREGSKTVPEKENIPTQYRDLVDWYVDVFCVNRRNADGVDPLLTLRGSGRGIWADEHADDYVRRLRENWP
ncbi:MAG TPA: hypothetical protein VN774_00025 [Candidatus Limnocylindrales bacterium]|nr:hypothetical protein [Candidatus Limnocylindrales bacterium]